MAINNWLEDPTYPIIATSATKATEAHSDKESVARVANVATSPMTESTTLQDLKAHYPAVIHNCRLTDILEHSDPSDYNDLMDTNIMKLFVESLLEFRRINSID